MRTIWGKVHTFDATTLYPVERLVRQGPRASQEWSPADDHELGVGPSPIRPSDETPAQLTP